MIIKIFLIFSVAAATAFIVRGGSSGRHLAIRRLAGLLFAGTWVAAVVSPDLVTRAANLVGVGRGTDLVLYLLAVAFLFTTVSERRHLREIDDRMAALTRELALGRASPPAPPGLPAEATPHPAEPSQDNA